MCKMETKLTCSSSHGQLQLRDTEMGVIMVIEAETHAHICHILSCNLSVMPLSDAVQVFQVTVFRGSLILNQFIALFSFCFFF